MFKRYLHILRMAIGSVLLVSFALISASCETSLPLASISGHVYRADNHQPIGNAKITVYGLDGSMGPKGSITTMAGGNYEVNGLNSGDSILVCQAQGYVAQYYSGVYEWGKSNKVITSYGKTTPNIDFYLEAGGSISGTIFEPDGITPTITVTKPGNDFKEAGVSFYQVSGIKTLFLTGDDPAPPTNSTGVDSDGRYRIDGLLTGEYDLVAVTTLAKGVRISTHKKVSVITGQETKGVDFVSLSGGSVRGHVYFEDGVTPAKGLVINAGIDTGYPIEGYYFGAGGSSIPSDGSYSLGLVPTGKVHISISSGDSRYAGRQYSTTVLSGQETVFDIVLSNN